MSNHHHESDTSTGSPNNNNNRNSPGFYGTTLFPPPLPPGRGPSNVPLPPSSSPNQPLGSYQNHHFSGIVDGHLDQLEPHHVFGGSGAESTPSLVGLNQTVAERSSQTLLLESSSKSTLGTMNNSLNSTTNSSSAQGNRSSSTSNNNNSNNNNTTNDNSSNSGRDRAEGTPPPPPLQHLQNDLITTTPSSGPTLVLGIPTSPARGPGEHHNNYYHGTAAVQQNASAAHPAVGSAFFDQSSEEGSPTHLNIPSLDAAAAAMNAIPLYHSSGSSTSDGGNLSSSGRGETTNIFPRNGHSYPAAPTSSPVPAGCLNTMSMMMLSSGTHSSSSENSSSHLHNNCLLAVTPAAESPIVPPIPISQHPHTSLSSHHHQQQHVSRQSGNPQSQTLDGGMTTVHYQQHAPNDVSNQSTRANIQQKTPQVTATSSVAPRFTPPPQTYSTQSPPLVFSPHRQDPLSISSNSPQNCSLLPPAATATATQLEEIQGEEGKDSAVVTTTTTWEPPLILHGPSSPTEVADMLGEEIRSDSLTRYALPYRASSSASGTSPRLSRRASIAHCGQSSPPAPTGNLHFLSSEEGVRDGGGEDGMLSSPHLHVLTPSVSESDLRRLRVLQRNQDGPLLEEAEDAFHDTTVVEMEETELLDELRHNAPSSGGESIDEPEDPLWWMEAFEEHVADMTTENKLALGF